MKNLKDLENLIKDRTVALVGNSSKVLEECYSIDQYDVVIRLNRAWDLPEAMKRSVGSKVDVLCLSAEQENLKRIFQSIENVVWMTPKRRKEFSVDVKDQLFFYPEEWWAELNQTLGARPSTGCMAFDLVRRMVGEGELTLYGFDFFKNPNWYNRNKLSHRIKVLLRLKKAGSPHNWDAEEKFIRSHSKEMGFYIESL